jgi:branched-chain amino acid transport system ATP-binding protein
MLEIRDLRVRYGAIEAVKGITVTVAEGEIVTLVGANGAGKTTTLRAVSGLRAAASGTIEFEGRRIDGLRAHRIAQLGLGHSPEGRRVFARLTVR